MKNLLFTLVAFSFVAVTACQEDFLEPTPTDRIDVSNFYEDPGEAEAALIGVYWRSFRELYVRLLIVDNVSSDDMLDDGGGQEQFDDRTALTPDNGSVGLIWSEGYQAMANLNLLIEGVRAIDSLAFFDENAPSNQINRKFSILAEARFLRAFIYYHMVHHFGDVPLLTKFPESSEPESNYVARTAAEVVRDTIKADLDYAMEYLPWDYESLGFDTEQELLANNKGRATKAAALVLRAREAMWDQDWTLAINLVDEVLDEGIFPLASPWVNIFNSIEADGLTQNFSSTIMEIQSTDGDPEFDNTGGYTWFTVDGPGRLQCTLEAYNSFEMDGQTEIDVRQAWSTAPNESVTEVKSVKYLNVPVWTSSTPYNFVPFRIAEAYLIKAEALAMRDGINAESLDLINQIRSRARDLNFGEGYPGIESLSLATFPSDAEFIDMIREERRHELLFEGHRWFDLLRWDSYDGGNRALQAAGLAGQGLDGRLLLPIPNREIRVNPELVQNPDYGNL